jgi:dihydrofolate reductase
MMHWVKTTTCFGTLEKTFSGLKTSLADMPSLWAEKLLSRFQRHSPGIVCCSSLEEALDLAKDDPQPFIIGGGQIYQQAMPFAHTLELTRVHDHFEADTFFPTIDPAIWQEVWRETHPKSDNQPLAYTFITYKKIATS